MREELALSRSSALGAAESAGGCGGLGVDGGEAIGVRSSFRLVVRSCNQGLWVVNIGPFFSSSGDSLFRSIVYLSLPLAWNV